MMKAFQPVLQLHHIASGKTDISKVLTLSCCFSILLLITRIIIAGSPMYGFLVWNLFLAYIPYFISNKLEKNIALTKRKLKFLLIFFAWLIFIPNSFYIITDLFHLDEGTATPQWFNLVLLFSFAWNGMLMGILSLRQMERIIEPILGAKWKWFFIYGVMILNALGIYIGRYLRFNSWDIVANPFQLAGDIIYLCIHPVRNIMEWGMIICYTVLMILVYQSIRMMSKVI